MTRLCKLGVHRWNTREVHLTEPVTDRWTVQAAIIERCACGEARVPPSGEPKITRFYLPDKPNVSRRRCGKPAQDQYIVPGVQDAWQGWWARAQLAQRTVSSAARA